MPQGPPAPFMAAEFLDLLLRGSRGEKVRPIAHQRQQQPHLCLIVFGAEECSLPPLPPLGDGVRDAGRHSPGHSRHGASVLLPYSRSGVQYGVPGILRNFGVPGIFSNEPAWVAGAGSSRGGANAAVDCGLTPENRHALDLGMFLKEQPAHVTNGPLQVSLT